MRATSGNGLLYALLPNPAKSGDEFDLTFHYHGNVIRNAGNGVLFVGARESWYPHLGDTAAFSTYDLTFHWPRKLRLAATGSAFSEWLVSSPYAAEITPDRLLGYLGGVPETYGADARPKKLEWMIRQAKSLAGK